MLTALVEHFAEHPELLPDRAGSTADPGPVHASVAYVAGMTDRFAFDTAVDLLDWPVERLPGASTAPR